MNRKSCNLQSCTASDFVRKPVKEVLPPVGIFWDIENCQVPKGKSAGALVQKIREKLLGRHCEAEFMCVCDINKESKIVIRELNLSQVTVVHICATCKNAADDKLKQCMRHFVDICGAYSAISLISNDVNFAVDLSDFRHRYKIKIILFHTSQAPKALLTLAHEHYDFFEITNRLPLRSPVKKYQNGPCELVVTNLPTCRSIHHIRNILKRKSDNCGGKVKSICGTSAVMCFKNSGAARRAQKRMDKEYMYGKRISVNFPQTSSAFSPSRLRRGVVENSNSHFLEQKLVDQESMCDRRISINFLQTPSSSSTELPALCALDKPTAVFPEVQEKDQNTEKYVSTLNNLWCLNRTQLLSVASLVLRYLSDIESQGYVPAIQLPYVELNGSTTMKVTESTAKNNVLTQTSPTCLRKVHNECETNPSTRSSKRQKRGNNTISTPLNEVQITPEANCSVTSVNYKSSDVSDRISAGNSSKICLGLVTPSSPIRKQIDLHQPAMVLRSSGQKSSLISMGSLNVIETLGMNAQVEPVGSLQHFLIQNSSSPSSNNVSSNPNRHDKKERANCASKHQQGTGSESSLTKRESLVMPSSSVKRPRRNPVRKVRCKKHI